MMAKRSQTWTRLKKKGETGQTKPNKDKQIQSRPYLANLGQSGHNQVKVRQTK